ncbi:MAG: hypothetical protein HDS00_08815 [Bacteroides sp.]|nr:hypothetical protein [Bacteroides sp.]
MENVDDGRISDAPFVLPDYTPHSASLHVGVLAKSLLYSSLMGDEECEMRNVGECLGVYI